MKKLLFTLLLTTSVFIHAQNTGYWDNLRTQKKEFKLIANNRALYELEVPYGTTQMILRVTVLDVNRKIPNTLSEIVGQVNTPNAQIASSLLSLSSVVMGADKCKFYLFKDKNDAQLYVNSNNIQNACYQENNPIVTSHKYFNGTCINEYSNKLYICIETTNITLPSNIIIELAPFVEPSKENGWTKEVRNAIYNELSNQYNEDLLNCLISKLSSEYTFQEATKLGVNEKRVLDDYAMKCMDDLGISKEVDLEIDNMYRDKADSLIFEGNYADAINILLVFDEEKTATDSDYNALGFAYILTKQYLKAIKYLKKGLLIDDTNLLLHGNLAHAYLLSNDYDKAIEIYHKFKNQNVDENMSWEDMIKEDFNTFLELGINCEKCQDVLKSL